MLLPLDIGRVLQHYNLGNLESASKAFHGFVNETAFVKTSQGRFVMRRNHRRLSEEVHRYRHALMARLRERGFPTPAPIPTKDGETLLVLDGRSYEVTPFIEAQDYDPNRPAQLLSVGETLAHYHRAVKDFPPPPGDTGVPRYSGQDVMALSERLLERDIMGDLYDMLMWYDLRAAKLRNITGSHYASLPHVVIHGDVHRDNFLFHDDTVVALLDFDQAAWDARIADIADLIVGFATDCTATTNVITWGVYKGPIAVECATDMLAAYHAVAPLTEAEVALLPTLIELLWLQGELGRVFSTPEGAPDYHQSVLDQGRWLSEWMQDHSDYLVSRWNNLPDVSEMTRGRIIAPAA